MGKPPHGGGRLGLFRLLQRPVWWWRRQWRREDEGRGYGLWEAAKRRRGGGFGAAFAAVVRQAHTVDKANRMLIDVARREAPNGRADFAISAAAISNVGYKTLSDSLTAAEFADGKGEGCVVLVIVCANNADMKLIAQGLRIAMEHRKRAK